ncbi:MAG: condensation domain-containing protein [Terracidiphilus sp.]
MPATPGQVRYWLLHQMHSGNHALNMPIAWTCRGKLDSDLAADALAELVRRHESLRTTFEEVDGQLSQVIHPPLKVPLPIEDLSHLPKDARQQQADAIIRQQARIKIDLEKGPLFLGRIIRMGVDENILLLTIHHIVCDGWSNGVVLRDFAAIYDGLVRHVPPGLPELPIQFGDFAVWLNEWRKGEEQAASLKYWRETLGGDFTPLRIQRDFSGVEAEEQSDIETLLLAPDLVQQARDFCAEKGVTLYVLLLSVYAAMLYRLSGQGDLLIGTPCANRRQETEELIGPFSNPQVIRMRMKKEDSLGAVLEHVRNWALGAVAHQSLPFEDLNEDEFFSRERNQISLQVYFIYQKAFMQAQHTPSLEIVPLRSVSPGTMFDLLLSIVERAEGPRLQLEYNPAFFRASTIQRILRLYVRILETMLSGTESPVGEVQAQDKGGQLMAASEDGAARGTSEQPGNSNDPLSGGLNTRAPEAGQQREEYVAPRDPLELQITGIWETAMGLRKLSVRDSFFDLGGQSLAAMRIVSRINKTYSLDFGLAVLFTGRTVERMAELVRKRLAANSASSIVPMQSAGSQAPLFILHGAGGNIIRFYHLAALVGTGHPIYGIQAQSLLAGQPALLRLEDQAASYLAEIREIQPKGPYYFLGYSFGGTLAFEIAQRLHALGEQVELLGMLDSRQLDCMIALQRDQPMLERFDRRIARFLGNFASLSLREKAAYLREKLITRALRRVYTVAAALGFRSVPSFMKSTDDISWVAAMNYRPQPWPGPITLFRASVQPDPRLPLDLGWTKLAEGGVEVYELPGDHDLVFREPNIRVLAAQLRARLERSDAAEVSMPEPAVIAK